MDEIDEWAFLGERENLPNFNPREVFSSSCDTTCGFQLSKDEDNGASSTNSETIDHLCSYSSRSSSTNIILN